jgi:hypothetical protein
MSLIRQAVSIKHFVYSSLPSIKERSEGKYSEVTHHESKVEIEKFAKDKLESVTTIIAGLFYVNLNGPGWTRREGEVAIPRIDRFRDSR